MISAVLPKMTTNFIFPHLHLRPLTCLTDVEVLSLCAVTIGSWFEPRIAEFDPQRNTNEKSEFNKPALCYSSLYLMLLTLCRLTRRWRWSELNQLWICLLWVKSTWNPREAWAAWIWIQHCVPFSCSQTVWTLQPKSDTLNITLSSNIFCCFLWHPSFKRSETSVWLTACWRFHHVHLEVYRPWLSCFQRYTCPFWRFKKVFGVKPSQLLKIFSQCGNWLNQRPDEKNCCYSFAELFICRMNSSARGHRFVCVVQHFFLKVQFTKWSI